MTKQSPYAFCANNPLKFVDPDGNFVTDYYNLRGNMVYHNEDNSTDKYLVLTQSNKEAEVRSMVDQGGMIKVPSNEIVDRMNEVFDLTEQTGNEHGFRVGNNATLSRIVEGTKGDVDDDAWKPAVKDLVDKGDRVSYDVHSHPLYKDEYGKIVGIGKPEASYGDQKNVVGNQPNIVLGYVQEMTKLPNSISNNQIENVRHIGFFNSTHKYGSFNFSSFESIIRKINRK